MKFCKRMLTLTLSISFAFANIQLVNAISSVEKIQGNNKYEIAGNVADENAYKTAILINTNNSIADGLSASGLAGALNAPILLTEKNTIPTETSARLKNVSKVYIIGGTYSISTTVENSLKSKNIKVVRIQGSDRIKTSYNVAKEINSIKKVDTVMLTNAYKGEADAISIASVATRDSTPIILTNGRSIPFSTSGLKSYAIGGTSSMSTALVNKTKSTRLGGSTRFETNKAIINKFYKDAKDFYIAGAYELTNALVGSSLSKNSPMVLVDNGSNKSVLKNAKKITSIGYINSTIIQQCLNVTNGIGDINTGIIKDDAKPTTKTIKAGMYKVGKDISAGEYLITSNSGSYASYYEVTSDSTGNADSILSNDIFNGTRYITLENGQYIKIEDSTMILAKYAKVQKAKNGKFGNGMYKIGLEIPAGEYTIVSNSSDAYYEVRDDSLGDVDGIVTNDVFSGNRYITVEEGQYLILNNCYLIESK
ncbi:cell wall-binding repeat-containing protein [Clostridioides difficile]|nr:cell wall-binding repeat-containing protein [Clostridioides difficile]